MGFKLDLLLPVVLTIKPFFHQKSAELANLPTSKAPRLSNMTAKIYACLRVSTLLPTEVPKALATSFAPIAKPRIKANMMPAISAHKTCA